MKKKWKYTDGVNKTTSQETYGQFQPHFAQSILGEKGIQVW